MIDNINASIADHAARAHAEIRKLTAQKWLEIVFKFERWNRSDAQRARRERERLTKEKA